MTVGFLRRTKQLLSEFQQNVNLVKNPIWQFQLNTGHLVSCLSESLRR